MAMNEAVTPDNITALRVKIGVGKMEFAKLLGTDSSTIRRWELHGAKPQPEYRRALRRLMEEHGIIPREDAQPVKMVTASNLTTLEQYAASMVMALISLKTLGSFGLAGFNSGLLEEDETETAKTIAWELRRLMELYNRHLSEILDRTNMTKEQIMASVASLDSTNNTNNK